MAVVNGRAKRFDGSVIDYVLIFEWYTGKRLSKELTDKAGNWTFEYSTNMVVGVTYVSDGCEPISHGPYDLVINKI